MPDVLYMPTVEELARLLPSRSSGRWTGGAQDAAEFPDRARVQGVIEVATSILAPQLGGVELDPLFHESASALIVLQTALMLEPALWPEQARPDKSAWEQWKQLLDDGLKGLLEAVVRHKDDGPDDTGPGSSQQVLASFPPPGLTPAPLVDIWGNPLPLQLGACGGVDW